MQGRLSKFCRRFPTHQNSFVNGAEKLGHWGAGIVYPCRDYLRQQMRLSRALQGHEETALAVRAWETSDRLAMLRAEDAILAQPYPSTCWMVQRLTSRSLSSSRWLTPFDRSARMYSRCCSIKMAVGQGNSPVLRLTRDLAISDRVPRGRKVPDIWC